MRLGRPFPDWSIPPESLSLLLYPTWTNPRNKDKPLGVGAATIETKLKPTTKALRSMLQCAMSIQRCPVNWHAGLTTCVPKRGSTKLKCTTERITLIMCPIVRLVVMGAPTRAPTLTQPDSCHCCVGPRNRLVCVVYQKNAQHGGLTNSTPHTAFASILVLTPATASIMMQHCMIALAYPMIKMSSSCGKRCDLQILCFVTTIMRSTFLLVRGVFPGEHAATKTFVILYAPTVYDQTHKMRSMLGWQ